MYGVQQPFKIQMFDIPVPPPAATVVPPPAVNFVASLLLLFRKYHQMVPLHLL